MAFCSNCGKELATGAKFCFECGTPVGQTNETVRRTVYSGEIHKCPSCGEVLQSMTAICPSCGHEISSAKLSSALKEFINEINECDKVIANTPKKEMPKKGWKTWKKSTRILWVILNIITSCIPLVVYLTLPLFKPLFRSNATPELSPMEQRKVSLIENFTFPNDRESVLEAMLFVKSKMAFLASEKANEKNAFWLRLWNTKAEQLHQKANILLNNDAIAETAYNNIVASKKTVDKKVRIRAGIGAGIIILFVAFVLINGSLLKGITNLIPDFNISSNDPSTDNFEWLDTGLCTKIPKIDAADGHYWSNSDTELNVRVEGISYAKFEKYITSCKDMGYVIDAKKDTSGYTAYNKEGYYLDLQHWGSSENLDIKLLAPLEGDENFVWPTGVIADVIPKVEYNSGVLGVNNSEELEISLYKFTKENFDAYVQQCKDAGFNIDSEENKDDTWHKYEAYNSNGYKLSVSVDNMGKLTINMRVPRKKDAISWPTTGPATMLPKPDNCVGEISIDFDWSFSVYVTDMSIDEFNAYVQKCIDKGFEKSLRTEHYFSADKGKDVSITIEYVGFDTVYISITDYDKL